MFQGKVYLSTFVLVTIGMFDLVTSLILWNQGFGESNPIFAPLLHYGSFAVAAAKLALLAGPVVLLEYARTKAPNSAEQGTWIAAAAYFVLYIAHLLRHFSA